VGRLGLTAPPAPVRCAATTAALLGALRLALASPIPGLLPWLVGSPQDAWPGWQPPDPARALGHPVPQSGDKTRRPPALPRSRAPNNWTGSGSPGRDDPRSGLAGPRLNRSITSGDCVMGMLPHPPLKTARERQPARSPHSCCRPPYMHDPILVWNVAHRVAKYICTFYNISYQGQSFFLMSPAPPKPLSIHLGLSFVILKPHSCGSRGSLKFLAR
jgi:hypothetical protein